MSATDVNAGLVDDTAARVRSSLGLSPDGVAYVKRFAAYLVRINGAAEVATHRAKRPGCKLTLTQGRAVRQAVARELAAELSNRGQKWRPPNDLVL